MLAVRRYARTTGAHACVGKTQLKLFLVTTDSLIHHALNYVEACTKIYKR
jgi:hypothetical protein